MPRRHLVRSIAIALVLGVETAGIGCASALVKPSVAPVLARADARVLEGCYDCLLEARDLYAGVAGAPGPPQPSVVSRLFETELLIALREKELGLDSAATLARANRLLPSLPPTLDGLRYLAIIDAVPSDELGQSTQAIRDFRAAHREIELRVDSDLDWLRASTLDEPARQYLALALNCSYPVRPPRRPAGDSTTKPGTPAPVDLPREPAPDAPPLLRYRVATCARIAAGALTTLRTDVPAFVETSYFLARVELGQAKDIGPGRARPLLDEVYARFSRSPSVTYLDGNFNQLIGDCKVAVGFYEQTLSLRPDHDRALLGRTACLTYLGLNEQAIESATRIIASGVNLGDGYYWRAFNQHRLGRLTLARQDINLAKTVQLNGAIWRLAGMIENDQEDLLPADHDFLQARSSSDGALDCVSMWGLGVVRMKRERWIESADQFADAMSCYQQTIALDEVALARVRRATNMDPPFQAAQIATLELGLKEEHSQQYASAFNAANHYAHGGDLEKARVFVELAAADPALADRVRELRLIIKMPMPHALAAVRYRLRGAATAVRTSAAPPTRSRCG